LFLGQLLGFGGSFAFENLDFKKRREVMSRTAHTEIRDTPTHIRQIKHVPTAKAKPVTD
jgi:hypothetical protein